jgi:hypothetical protein
MPAFQDLDWHAPSQPLWQNVACAAPFCMLCALLTPPTMHHCWYTDAGSHSHTTITTGAATCLPCINRGPPSLSMRQAHHGHRNQRRAGPHPNLVQGLAHQLLLLTWRSLQHHHAGLDPHTPYAASCRWTSASALGAKQFSSCTLHACRVCARLKDCYALRRGRPCRYRYSFARLCLDGMSCGHSTPLLFGESMFEGLCVNGMCCEHTAHREHGAPEARLQSPTCSWKAACGVPLKVWSQQCSARTAQPYAMVVILY